MWSWVAVIGTHNHQPQLCYHQRAICHQQRAPHKIIKPTVYYIMYALASVCTAEILSASCISFPRADDNCSLSITYECHIFPTSQWCIWHASFHQVREIGEGRDEALAQRASMIGVKRKRQSICLIWMSSVRWEELMHRARSKSETRKKPNGKIRSTGPCQAIGLYIIRGEKRKGAGGGAWS